MAEQRQLTPKEKQIENIIRATNSPRINEKDKGVIRNSFANREHLLVSVRNLFFGQADTEEKKVLKELFNSDEVKRVIRKVLQPTLLPDDPFKQSIDLWQIIDFSATLDDESIQREIDSQTNLIEMIEWSLGLMDDVNEKPVNLNVTKWKPAERTYAKIKSRNQFISHLETHFVSMVAIASSEPEDPEKAAIRRKQDSSK